MLINFSFIPFWTDIEFWVSSLESISILIQSPSFSRRSLTGFERILEKLFLEFKFKDEGKRVKISTVVSKGRESFFKKFVFDSDSWQTCGRYSPWCFSPFTLPTWPHSWSRGRSFTNSRAWTITVWPNLGPTSLCSSSVRYLGAIPTARWPNTSRRCTRTWRSSTRAAWPKGSRRLSAGKSIYRRCFIM